MPTVSEAQENSSHARIERKTAESRRFAHSPPNIMANGPVKPTNPRYNVGGWNSISTVLNSGLRPIPSSGVRPKRSNGSSTYTTSARKKHVANIITAEADSQISGCVRRSLRIEIAEKSVSSQPHSISDPLCPPHRAATR